MKIDVKKVAKLADLPLSKEEEDKYSKQLSQILEYIEQLSKVDTSKVKPTFNVTPSQNVMREDKTRASLSQDEALMNAPQKRDGYIITTGVFKE